MTNNATTAPADLDDAVADGIEIICDECGDMINEETGACHPYCPHMVGDDFKFPANF